jgi:hypothetical protein
MEDDQYEIQIGILLLVLLSYTNCLICAVNLFRHYGLKVFVFGLYYMLIECS